MNRAELKVLIQELMGDRKGKSFSGDQLSEAIEYAVNLYCEKTACTYQEIEASRDGAFLDIPEGALKVIRVASSVLGELDETTITDEGSRRPNWRSDAVGEPNRWLRFNAATVRIHPPPDSDPRTFTLGYVEAPDPIVDDQDPISPFIAKNHLRLLRYAAAAWLLTDQGDEEDVQRAQAYMQIFNSSIGA